MKINTTNIICSIIVFLTSLASYFVVFVFIPTNAQLKQAVFYDGPIVQKLEINKTPSSNEGPTPPAGVSPEIWKKEFTYRIVGKIENFDRAAYKAKHAETFFAPHKDAPPSIYTKHLPTKEEIGQYKIGLSL